MKNRTPLALDLLALGAAALPTQGLLRILTRGRLPPDEIDELSRALLLRGPTRDAALRGSRAGPVLLAALELGRRAQRWPSPAGGRVQGPTDVAAILVGRCVEDDDELWALALDARLTLARAQPIARGVERAARSGVAEIIGPVLAAGCRRVVLAHRQAGPSRPAPTDARATQALAEAAALVDVAVLDHVIVGDDGHTSLLRSGLLQSRDLRYR